jgi:SsrA-binding protein
MGFSPDSRLNIAKFDSQIAVEKKQTNIAVNRKASFEYHLEATFEAGLVLTGTEIKSVRNSQVSLADAYCVFINDALWVKGMHIAEYKDGSYNNHISKRDRKLLLNKNELRKLHSRVKEKGYSIIPVRIYISEKGYAKLEIALAKGKKTYDKREDLKKKDAQGEMDRMKKIKSSR